MSPHSFYVLYYISFSYEGFAQRPAFKTEPQENIRL